MPARKTSSRTISVKVPIGRSGLTISPRNPPLSRLKLSAARRQLSRARRATGTLLPQSVSVLTVAVHTTAFPANSRGNELDRRHGYASVLIDEMSTRGMHDGTKGPVRNDRSQSEVPLAIVCFQWQQEGATA